jgi:hypothetical protein
VLADAMKAIIGSVESSAPAKFKIRWTNKATIRVLRQAKYVAALAMTAFGK